MVSLEHIFQAVAYCGIQGVHIGGRYAFAVRRIGHKYACRLRSFIPARYRLDFKADILGHTGTFYILAGYVDGFGRYVGAHDGIHGIALSAVVVEYAVEQVGVEILPALEGKAAAIDAGIDVGGNHGSLDKEGS